jgi:predicted RND superfamily exporter protein
MQGQVESFAWAMVFITIVLIVALRSLPLGLLSVIPNVAPIAAMIGAMGYLGISLNSFNSMIASIAIGIAVDDTIHILTGFQRFSKDLPVKAAIRETVAHEGAAILATSTVLFAGFCVLLLATFVPTANFGLLTAIAIGFALVGDLVILPGVLLLVWPSRKEGPKAEA